MKTRQLKPVITKYLVWGEGFGGILPTQIGEWPFYGKSFLFHKIPVMRNVLLNYIIYQTALSSIHFQHHIALLHLCARLQIGVVGCCLHNNNE